MSILDLDLNIDNYELHEVESFMRLVSPYTLNDVIENEKLIIGVISQDVNCPVEKKSEFIEFMKSVKQMLVHNLKKQLDRTIENDQLLPDEEYVIENLLYKNLMYKPNIRDDKSIQIPSKKLNWIDIRVS